MADDRPGFTHKPPKHGLVGPFSGRQLLLVGVLVAGLAVVLVAVTTPLGTAGVAPAPVDPRATPFVIGEAPAEGLRAGDTAPEFTIDLDDGSTYQLRDLDSDPVTLAELRGKVVWINFWASWCPPCQQETPILRDLDERYRDRGLEIVGVSVQETSVDDVRAYADRYGLGYTIGFDGSGHVFRAYKIYALPTQFFVDVNGVIAQVVNGPVD
ncbi:MAG: TlpA family protein disulfide reductase, partial [Chloroflexota bacterium]|nr:TlpA family protein disulfide reductase [Chloroflexota bacterium]